jgi:hypothetical protein
VEGGDAEPLDHVLDKPQGIATKLAKLVIASTLQQIILMQFKDAISQLWRGSR